MFLGFRMTVFCLYFRTLEVVLLAPLPTRNSNVIVGRFQHFTSDRSFNFERKKSGFLFEIAGCCAPRTLQRGLEGSYSGSTGIFRAV